MVTIPREEYVKLREAAEELADIEAYDRAMSDPGEAIPADYVRRMVEGESPLRVFRDLRGLTQMGLAERANVNRVGWIQLIAATHSANLSAGI